jgi:hypothetical protein
VKQIWQFNIILALILLSSSISAQIDSPWLQKTKLNISGLTDVFMSMILANQKVPKAKYFCSILTDTTSLI